MRLRRRNLPSPTASHSALAAEPEASATSNTSRQGKARGEGRRRSVGRAAEVEKSTCESGAVCHGWVKGSNRQIASNACA